MPRARLLLALVPMLVLIDGTLNHDRADAFGYVLPIMNPLSQLTFDDAIPRTPASTAVTPSSLPTPIVASDGTLRKASSNTDGKADRLRLALFRGNSEL